MTQLLTEKNKSKPTSTVGRGKAVKEIIIPNSNFYSDDYVSLFLNDSLNLYDKWLSPTCIISDGAYGILGFEGDTSDHLDIVNWYRPHIEMWSKYANPNTTLWFWNSEIGWASVHSTLEKFGWKYVSANIWDKGMGHIAGNVNTSTIRRFPVTTEICVQYAFETQINNMTLKQWLRYEWQRSGLPLNRANEACGVRNAATRKYFDQGHLWYFPPPEMFKRLQEYANKNGNQNEAPFYSLNGKNPISEKEWEKMRYKFYCQYGVTNVWNRASMHNSERIKTNENKGKAVHLNQKPLDLMQLIIKASTDEDDVVWEPFGGLFSASLAAKKLKRIAFSAEIDPTYFCYGLKRFT